MLGMGQGGQGFWGPIMQRLHAQRGQGGPHGQGGQNQASPWGQGFGQMGQGQQQPGQGVRMPFGQAMRQEGPPPQARMMAPQGQPQMPPPQGQPQGQELHADAMAQQNAQAQANMNNSMQQDQMEQQRAMAARNGY